MQPWQPHQSSGYPPSYGYPFASPMPRYAYASFWRRLIALILDSILTAIAAFSLIAVLWAMTGIALFDIDTEDSGFSFTAGNWPVSLLITAYFVILNGRGATLGKMALGIRVTNREGDVPGLAKGALREIIPAIGLALDPILSLATRIAEEIGGWDAAFTTGAAGIGIVLGYGLLEIVDGLSMIGDDYKQTLHDKMGGTYVIRG